MNRRSALTVIVAVVAASLLGAPVTMSDWGHQASFSTERVEASEIDEHTPLLRYENLSEPAQTAVRRAIESSDGYHVVYGHEDWPDRFFYSDDADPGTGLYAVAYEGQQYRLYTAAAGGFPFVYWLSELPFVLYGAMLGVVAHRTSRGEFAPRVAALATATGVAFHLLGPEFDFPLLAPRAFSILGVAATGIVGLGCLYLAVRESEGATD